MVAEATDWLTTLTSLRLFFGELSLGITTSFSEKEPHGHQFGKLGSLDRNERFGLELVSLERVCSERVCLERELFVDKEDPIAC